MIDISNVTPKWDLVIVKLSNLEATFNELIIQDRSDSTDIAIRYGEVIAIGPLATTIEHCPGLHKGDKVIFTEYAGYYIASKDSENLYKVIRGYDIIGKYMEEKTLTIPTGNRVLIETVDFTKQEDGLIYDAKDPKLADLHYGKVLKVNNQINKSNLFEGQLVAFPTYVGTIIRHYESDENKELKIIVEEDILFTV